MLGNKQYCYPLTVTDYASRFLICCEGLESTKEAGAFAVFEQLFKEYGLPGSIRSDNGVPFASPNAIYGLSSLSVWRLRLGIGIERIKPGNPQQNGRHERMHLTLKQATTKPPAKTLPPKVLRVCAAKCKPCDWFTPLILGRTGEIRTRDQRIKSPLLYRLSYRPIFMVLPKMIQRLIGLFAVKKRLLVTFSPANLKL